LLRQGGAARGQQHRDMEVVAAEGDDLILRRSHQMGTFGQILSAFCDILQDEVFQALPRIL
jgi:hypothetical protein